MTRLVIRKSGGANIISIPRAILKILDLHTNSAVELSLENNRIVLTPVKEELTLNDLLSGSPKEKLRLKEDKEWLEEKPQGQEEF